MTRLALWHTGHSVRLMDDANKDSTWSRCMVRGSFTDTGHIVPDERCIEGYQLGLEDLFIASGRWNNDTLWYSVFKEMRVYE